VDERGTLLLDVSTAEVIVTTDQGPAHSGPEALVHLAAASRPGSMFTTPYAEWHSDIYPENVQTCTYPKIFL